MLVVGLTGSIGMGKSETAKMFTAEGVPVFDADATVHRLQAKDGPAIPAIEAAFPDVVTNGVLDRALLGTLVFSDAEERKKLEAIMHPMVAEERLAFFENATKSKAPFVVLDIPLLFETGGDKACDKIVVVSAPAQLQRERVLSRPGMTAEKFEQISSKQTPDEEKRKKADFTVSSGNGLAFAQNQVADICVRLREIAKNA